MSRYSTGRGLPFSGSVIGSPLAISMAIRLAIARASSRRFSPGPQLDGGPRFGCLLGRCAARDSGRLADHGDNLDGIIELRSAPRGERVSGMPVDPVRRAGLLFGAHRGGAEAIDEIENIRRRTAVSGKRQMARVRRARQIEDPHVGAAKTVDGLFFVAHDEQFRRFAGRRRRGKQRNDLVLQAVGVLILVDQDRA